MQNNQLTKIIMRHGNGTNLEKKAHFLHNQVHDDESVASHWETSQSFIYQSKFRTYITFIHTLFESNDSDI